MQEASVSLQQRLKNAFIEGYEAERGAPAPVARKEAVAAFASSAARRSVMSTERCANVRRKTTG
jgi:hypothetical protein